MGEESEQDELWLRARKQEKEKNRKGKVANTGREENNTEADRLPDRA